MPLIRQIAQIDFRNLCLLGFLLLALSFVPSTVFSMDYLTIKRSEKTIKLVGEIVVDAQNGDAMMRTQDGRIWMLQAAEIQARDKDDKPFVGLNDVEAEKLLLGEFSDGFQVHRTKHYIICHNTSDAYAQWVAGLYERLHAVFFNYWDRHDFEMRESDTPLIVLIFNSRENYARYVTKELGADPGSMVAYYNLESNRVTMYDLTGAGSEKNGKRRTTAQINTILSQKNSAAMVATVVHEATHQLAFNSGVQTRFADWPFWVSEGLAMYFETPSLKSSKGWSGLGKVNRIRLVQMRQFISRRGEDSLKTLIADDKRFRDAEKMIDTYAESWALNYFLIRKYPKQYFAYMHALSKKKPLVEDGSEKRLAMFEEYFGDMSKLDARFKSYIRSLR